MTTRNMILNIYSWTKNFVGFESIVSNKIDSVISKINAIDERITQMALNLDALTAEVEHTKTVEESAIVLLQNLTAELADVSAKLAATPKDVPVDTSGLDDLVSKLKASTDSLAAAVAANTPAAPAPVEVPAAPVDGNPV